MAGRSGVELGPVKCWTTKLASKVENTTQLSTKHQADSGAHTAHRQRCSIHAPTGCGALLQISPACLERRPHTDSIQITPRP